MLKLLSYAIEEMDTKKNWYEAKHLSYKNIYLIDNKCSFDTKKKKKKDFKHGGAQVAISQW